MMREGFAVERIERSSLDYPLMVLLLLLLGLGLSSLFSASYYYAGIIKRSPFYFVKRQAIMALLGLVVALTVSHISLEFIRKFIPVLLLVTFVLMLLTFVPPLGQDILGARRWLNIFGHSFQPSELVKLSLVIYLSHILSKKQENIDDFVNSVLPPFIIVFIFCGLIYLQNDFSTAVFVFFVCLLMFFIAKVRLIYFGLMAAILGPLAFILLFTKEHRVERLITFLRPDSDVMGSGFQVNAALQAIARGGLWGTGPGRGTKKLGGLPEAYSDFILAVVGEEAGLIGIIFVITLFVAFAVRGYMIMSGSKDAFSSYLAFGCTTMILYQALLNMAVVSGLIPATGLTLPFFSHGGSSILVVFAMCGLLLNVSRGIEKRGRGA